MSAAAKILEALRAAAEGNLARVRLENGQTWVRLDADRSIPAQWWAIGYRTARGFRIRRLVVGRFLARQEKREGETIRKASVLL